jgi:hypothetical protein
VVHGPQAEAEAVPKYPMVGSFAGLLRAHRERPYGCRAAERG